MHLPIIFVDGAAGFTVTSNDFFGVPVGSVVFSLVVVVGSFASARCTVDVLETDLGVVVELVTVEEQQIETLHNNAITVNNFIATEAPRCATQRII